MYTLQADSNNASVVESFQLSSERLKSLHDNTIITNGTQCNCQSHDMTEKDELTVEMCQNQFLKEFLKKSVWFAN